MDEPTMKETMESQEFSDEIVKQRIKQYEELITQLMSNGFSRRNAKRYIESKSKKQVKKFKQLALKSQHQPKNFIDPEKELDIM